MVKYKSQNVKIQYVSETSYGSGGSIGTAIEGKINNFSPSLNNNLEVKQGLGEGRNATLIKLGVLDASFSVTYELATPDFLIYAIGARSGSGTTASKYVLTEADNIGFGASDIKTFKLEVAGDESTDDVDTYSGCHITDFTLNGSIGGSLVATVNCVAKTVTSSTTATSFTPNSVTPFIFQQGSIKWGSSPTAITGVQSFSISMNNTSIIYRDFTSGRFINQPETGVRRYNFTLNMIMDSALFTTLRDDFYQQANSPVTGVSEATIPVGDKLQIDLSEGSSSGDRNLQIFLEDAGITDMSKPVDLGGDLVQVTFTGVALKGGNSLKPLQFWTAT